MIHGYERANATEDKEEAGPTAGPPAPGEAPSASEFFAAVNNSKVH